MHFDDGLEAGDFKHPIADRVFVNEFKKVNKFTVHMQQFWETEKRLGHTTAIALT